MKTQNNQPSQLSGVNWKSVKECMHSLARYEHASFNGVKYDLSNGVAYECHGYNLMGSGSVIVTGLSSSQSTGKWDHFLVSTNKYRVFEFRESGSTGRRETGRFLVLMYCLSKNYAILATMNHTEITIGNKISEHVTYAPIGRYVFSSCSGDPNSVDNITKELHGCDCCYGYNDYGCGFDVYENARKKAYGLKPSEFCTPRTKPKPTMTSSNTKSANPFKTKRK